jgi:hypothetical protein
MEKPNLVDVPPWEPDDDAAVAGEFLGIARQGGGPTSSTAGHYAIAYALLRLLPEIVRLNDRLDQIGDEISGVADEIKHK